VHQSYVIVIGASHKTAPLAVRERLAINDDEAPSALHYLKEYATEALILSTCNRTELYLVTTDMEQALSGAMGLLSARSGIPLHQQECGIYGYSDNAAVSHLLEVAAGMDSLVPGEHEILTQIRRANKTAREHGTLGPILERLCQVALHAGKRARTETSIGRHPASVSLAAARLAQEVCNGLEGRSALVVGAGQTARLTAQALRSCGIGTIHAVNRTFAKAQDMAQQVGGHAWEMSAFPLLLPRVDVVVSCTSAPETILSMEELVAAQSRRHGSPMLLIDLAVPRDIDPHAREVSGITLYDLDDLQRICERNQAARRQAIGQVEVIVHQETQGFLCWQQERQAARLVTALRESAEEMRSAEVAKSLKKLSHLSATEQEAIEALTMALVNKLLHNPTIFLKTSDVRESTRVARTVFGLALPSEDNEIHVRNLLENEAERVGHG